MLALKEGKALEKIFLQNTLYGPETAELRRLAEEAGTPVSKVPVEKINNFNVTGHEGCVAQLARVKYIELQQLISFVVEKGETPFFIMLDGVTDIRNIGAIARSAYCFGVNALIIPEKGVGVLNEDAILTSAGALEHLSVCRVRSLMKAVDELHLNGIKVWAAEMKEGSDIAARDLTEPCALVLGAEEKGIYPALAKICDGAIHIPMPGEFDSLNVSVAAGICMYEVCRQRASG